MILGASSVAQLKDNLEICDAGPLPEEVVQTIEEAWPNIRDVAPWAWIQVTKPVESMSNVEGKSLEELGVSQ